MSTKSLAFALVVLLVSLIILTVGLASAQGEPPRSTNAREAVDLISNYIPVQGRLTDSSGVPINGNFDLTFRLYEYIVGGLALCADTKNVAVDHGLFSTYMAATSCPIDGRQLFLGVEVESDGEMTPRQYIDNVPYAWSLRPGAIVEASMTNPILHIYNMGDGIGLQSGSFSDAGVLGTSINGPGVEAYSINGPAVYAESDLGVAIAAHGAIVSNQLTYLWISGNGARPYHQSDSTVIDMNNHGGAMIYRGATPGSKNVMLPITIPGTLYGQPVRVTDLDLYWIGETQFDVISAVLMRRQTGVCSTSSCYLSLLHDTIDHSCESGSNPTGCILHYSLTTNNVLTSSSGVLYLTIELSFNSASSQIDFGGARLTLEYNN